MQANAIRNEGIQALRVRQRCSACLYSNRDTYAPDISKLYISYYIHVRGSVHCNAKKNKQHLDITAFVVLVFVARRVLPLLDVDVRWHVDWILGTILCNQHFFYPHCREIVFQWVYFVREIYIVYGIYRSLTNWLRLFLNGKTRAAVLLAPCPGIVMCSSSIWFAGRVYFISFVTPKTRTSRFALVHAVERKRRDAYPSCCVLTEFLARRVLFYRLNSPKIRALLRQRARESDIRQRFTLRDSRACFDVRESMKIKDSRISQILSQITWWEICYLNADTLSAIFQTFKNASLT